MRSWGGGEGQLYKHPLLCGTAQLCCGQVKCCLSALSFIQSQTLSLIKSYQKKTKKWTDKDTSKGINQLLPPAGFTSTKKILWMSYQMCPARKREHSCPEMGNTAALFSGFLFPQSTFPTRTSRIKDQHRLHAAES